MANVQDKQNHVPLNEDELQLLARYEGQFIKMVMLLYEMGCKKVLEVPFSHNGENFKLRIEKGD
jgi:uncharacterized protein YkuJ